MGAEIFDDLADIFTGAFGEDVVWIPSDFGNAVRCTGIFDHPYAEAELDNGARLSGRIVTCDFAAADSVGIAEGHRITRKSVVYRVAGQPEPDGRGMVKVRLTLTQEEYPA
jgi:hypothetical protein